jgi:2-phospho-L-lactate guanylyltransferase
MMRGPTDSATTSRRAIIVPLKRFDRAKQRLRASADVDVTRLARDLAAGVLAAAAPRPTIVLSESASVAQFARRHGAHVLTSRAHTLNEAVQNAYAELGGAFDQLIIVHGDLANPEGISSFDPGAGVTIVVDHHGRGTNVLAVPTRLDFHFAYGSDSARRHRHEATRLNQSCSVIIGSPWSLDVDDVDDLSSLT